MERKPITEKGFQKLQSELSQLIKVERPKIIRDIEEARAHGDLKENAEYHAAKERQGFIEGRIQTLNAILANAEIIKSSETKDDRVRFGATVTYQDLETEQQTTWKIVGEEESDIENGEISISSPIARALLGKAEGDEVVIRIPRGTMEVEVVSIKYQ
jgi:transcription elongation factor GreA